MKIEILGGMNEIGGNKILLQYKRTKIFLDFGKSFALENKYFDYPFLQPFYIDDLKKINALPQIPGLYRNERLNANIDAVLVSHPHLDHYGYIPMLKENTKIYLGEGALALIKAKNEITSKTWDRKIEHLKFYTFHSNETIEINDIQVLPIHVDHSVPASYGFIIFAGDKTIAYTGDFRLHGYKHELTKDFLNELEKETIDILICEGTNLSREVEYAHKHVIKHEIICNNESDVKKNMINILNNKNGLTIVETSQADIDRVRTIFEVAKALKRPFVLTAQQAYLTFILKDSNFVENLPDSNEFFLYLDRARKRGTENDECYKEGRKTYQQKLIERCEPYVIYGRDGRERLRNSNAILCTDNAAKRFIELKNKNHFLCNFILSKSEPFNEEMQISFDKLMNWLLLHGLDEYHRVHVSGHATYEELKILIDKASPKLIIPIHTTDVNAFKTLHKNVKIKESMQI